MNYGSLVWLDPLVCRLLYVASNIPCMEEGVVMQMCNYVCSTSEQL